jgi:hypothetical protein
MLIEVEVTAEPAQRARRARAIEEGRGQKEIYFF